jgi:hypothetical protein
MNDKSLMRQPFNFNQRDELRALFKQYLQSGDDAERLIWETITTQNAVSYTHLTLPTTPYV